MADVLYLIKANRVREYRHQNLAIIAAAEGERFEITYGERWVEPGLEVRPGTGCALVIADSPYRHYQPLRWGVVDEAEWVERRLRLLVRMGPFVLDGEQLTEAWARDADADAARGGSAKTRPYFAFVEPNRGLRAPHSRDEQDRAWHLAVDGLAANAYFDGASLCRVREVRTADGVPVDGTASVPEGSEVTVAVETRSLGRAETDLEVALEANPVGAVRLAAPATVVAEGGSEFTVVVAKAGMVRARVNLLPDALVSSRPILAFTVTEAPPLDAAAAGGPEVGVSVAGVRRLMRRLERDASMDPVTWISVLEDFFVPWSSADLEIVAELAEALLGAGRYRELEALLAAIDRRSPRLDLLLLLSAIRNGTAVDYLDLLGRVDLDDADAFAGLVPALQHAPVEVLRPVVEPLHRDVLGDDRNLTLLTQILPRVRSGDFFTTLAEEVAYRDPDLGARFLLDRWPDPAVMYRPALALVVDIGARPNQLGPYVREWLQALAADGKWAEVLGALPTARRALGATDRSATLGAVGVDLLASSEPDVERAGFELVIEATQEACRTGQLDTAATLVKVLAGNLALAVTDEERHAAQQLMAAVDAALEESDALRDWRTRRSEDRYRALIPSCRNKVLHLVGGLADPWEAELAGQLELAKVIRHEAEKGKSPTADWADATNPDEDVVVILWERIGHALATRVKDACRRRHVLVIEARSGQRGLLDALEATFT